MKKLFLMIVMACSVAVASASGPDWGVKAGLNFANLGRDADASARVGFHLGAVAEWDFTKLVSFQPEALFSLKGADEITAYYLDIPLNVKFNWDLGPGSINLTVGPYIAIGLFGEVSDYDWFKSDFNHRFDIGGGLGVGYEFPKKVFLQLGYSFGFMNVNDVPHSSVNYNNMNCNLSVGYKF